ncbi:selenocysteine lyase [Amanita muscaria]
MMFRLKHMKIGTIDPKHLLLVNAYVNKFWVLNPSGFIFADNASGSQCAKGVVDLITDYLLNSNSDYSVSTLVTRRVPLNAPSIARQLFNARSPDEIVFSSSSTMNMENLARGVDNEILPRDEIIVTGEHETNVDADRRFTACSNIFGSIIPVRDVVTKVARAEAKSKSASKVEISVDCVAYASHRLIDVQDWDVDFCVYGPHTSALYVRSRLLRRAVFVKFHPCELSLSFEAIALHEHELALLRLVLGYLTHPDRKARGVRIVDDEKSDSTRVPTISCWRGADQEKYMVAAFDRKNKIDIRYGHFYAIVRISLVHYNTITEANAVVETLEEILA